MLKVGIITFHFVNNFGGVLQAYALSEFIKREYNAEVMVIDYRNPFILFCDAIRLFPITVDTKEIVPGLSSIGQRFGRYLKTTTFIRHEVDVSKKFLSYAELKKASPRCTHYIAGSDQIWNPYITFGIDKPYYLGFAGKESKKISYAASFGGDICFIFKEKELKNF